MFEAALVIVMAERGAIEYRYVESKSTVPLNAESVGFTSSTRVVQPAPAAKCGMTMGSVEAGEVGAMGSVVISTSLRSFTKPRRAIAPTATDDVNVKDLAAAGLLYGAWSKNAAYCS